jgi:putative transposase
MSRRGNCHDNAAAESFFQLLERERIRRRNYPTRDAARQDVFEYIELFYNPKRKHTYNGMLSPVDFENRQLKLNQAGVLETRGTSPVGSQADHAPTINLDQSDEAALAATCWRRRPVRTGAAP